MVYVVLEAETMCMSTRKASTGQLYRPVPRAGETAPEDTLKLGRSGTIRGGLRGRFYEVGLRKSSPIRLSGWLF